MTDTPTPSQIRSEIEDLVLKDLLGPAGGPEEELGPLEDRVRERYLVGMLAPKKSTVRAESLDELAAAGTDSYDEGTTELPNAQSGSMLPSSLGMTFALAGDAEALRITVRWGAYSKIKSDTEKNKKTGEPAQVWKRKPAEGTSEPIPVREGMTEALAFNSDYPDVTVQGRMRRDPNGWLVTLFLVNGQKEPGRGKDKAWLFQPELIVESPDGSPIFRKRVPKIADTDKTDPITRMESRTLAMLYRNRIEFAVGHNVGVHADVRS